MKHATKDFSQMFGSAGCLFAEWRRERRLSQFELAEIAGCHVNSVQNIERGVADAKFTMFSRICMKLDCAGIELDARGWKPLASAPGNPTCSLPPEMLRSAEMVARVGAKVQERRLAAGYSLRVLATKAHVHVNTLWNLERGLTDPTISTLYRIYRALGVTLIEFVQGELTLR